MLPEDPTRLCLQGSLLLAEPALQDPGFRRTVLLLTEHRPDDGAHGYVLNRPMGKSAGELLPEADLGDLAEVPVFTGGPVSPEQLTFAALTWDPGAETLLCTTHLTREDALARLHRGESVRAFVGYSGWAAGQLENELQHRSWITCRPVPAVADPDSVPLLWRDLLRGMGPYYQLLSGMPEDPGLN